VLYAGLWLILAGLTLNKQKSGQWRHLAMLCAGLAMTMNVTYQAMKLAVPATRPLHFDQQLAALDLKLFGTNPNLWLTAHASNGLTELLSACYLFFMPLLLFFLLRYFVAQRHYLGEFYAGLFLVYGLGFIGYLLVPAQGPYMAQPWAQSFQLPGGWITELNHTMVINGSNKVDVWPSLHCAVSLYILGYTWWRHRLEFWWLLLPVMGLWVSTLYLGFHYLIDVVCGFALAGLALHLTRRYELTHVPAYNMDLSENERTDTTYR
jgi:membrane-associated phospholipid phosphatase